MITRDFHGWKPAGVEIEVDHIVGSVRMTHEIKYAEFITGNGVNKQTVVRVLKEYGIEGQSKLGNSGVIVATIE